MKKNIQQLLTKVGVGRRAVGLVVASVGVEHSAVTHGILEIRQYMPHFEIWLRVRCIWRQNMLNN